MPLRERDMHAEIKSLRSHSPTRIPTATRHDNLEMASAKWRLVALVAVLAVSAVDARKPKPPADDGADRMRSEIDASGEVAESAPPQSAEMMQKEAVATAQLNAEYKDALSAHAAFQTRGCFSCSQVFN